VEKGIVLTAAWLPQKGLSQEQDARYTALTQTRQVRPWTTTAAAGALQQKQGQQLLACSGRTLLFLYLQLSYACLQLLSGIVTSTAALLSLVLLLCRVLPCLLLLLLLLLLL
jgi:hypothetical protein